MFFPLARSKKLVALFRFYQPPVDTVFRQRHRELIVLINTHLVLLIAPGAGNIGKSITGMLIASLLSLVPIKGYEYNKKYWAFALVTILVFQSLILLGISASYVYEPARKIENTASPEQK